MEPEARSAPGAIRGGERVARAPCIARFALHAGYERIFESTFV
jgi:hypothetical protein